MPAVARCAQVRADGTARTPAAQDDEGPAAGLVAAHWGWTLRSGSPAGRVLLRMAEAATAAAGLSFVLMALAQWLMPGTILSGEVLGHKAALTAFLVMSGLLLLRYAGQGFLTEVHLDRLRGEVRVVACNRAGQVRLLDSLAFDEIAAIEVARGAGDGATRGRLLIHLVHGDAPLALVSGPAARLSTVAAAFARVIEQTAGQARAPAGDLGRVAPDCG